MRKIECLYLHGKLICVVEREEKQYSMAIERNVIYIYIKYRASFFFFLFFFRKWGWKDFHICSLFTFFNERRVFTRSVCRQRIEPSPLWTRTVFARQAQSRNGPLRKDALVPPSERYTPWLESLGHERSAGLSHLSRDRKRLVTIKQCQRQLEQHRPNSVASAREVTPPLFKLLYAAQRVLSWSSLPRSPWIGNGPEVIVYYIQGKGDGTLSSLPRGKQWRHRQLAGLSFFTRSETSVMPVGGVVFFHTQWGECDASWRGYLLDTLWGEKVQ